MMATPTMRAATQGAVSLALGMLVSNFGKKKKLGRQLAEGGLTVAMHGMGKGMLGPTLGLSGMDDSLLGYTDESLLGMGMYENMNDGGIGWVSPAPVSDFGDDLDEFAAYESFDN